MVMRAVLAHGIRVTRALFRSSVYRVDPAGRSLRKNNPSRGDTPMFQLQMLCGKDV